MIFVYILISLFLGYVVGKYSLTSPYLLNKNAVKRNKAAIYIFAAIQRLQEAVSKNDIKYNTFHSELEKINLEIIKSYPNPNDNCRVALESKLINVIDEWAYIKGYLA